MKKYMFDTNIYNHILDGDIVISKFENRAQFVATHIQIDELKNTQNIERRKKLQKVFQEVTTNELNTDTFILDTSRLDHANLGDGELHNLIKAELDKKNKGKANNHKDALIAETAINNSITFVTHDSDLFSVVTKLNGACVNFFSLESELV